MTATTAESEPSVQFEVSGYVQGLAVPFDQSSVDAVDPSTGRVLNERRFLLRRARITAAVDYGIVSGSLMFDGNTVDEVTGRILAAEARFRLPSVDDEPSLLQVRLGMFRTPFGAEPQWSSQVRPFIERTNVSRALFPGAYDAGLEVFGAWRFLRYQVAIMNGSPIGDRVFSGIDPSAHLDLMGRVGVDVALTNSVRIIGGGSLLVGEGLSPGTPGTKDTLTWQDANENGIVELSELQVLGGVAATPPAAFSRSALGGDLRVEASLPYVGQLAVFGEVMWALNLDRGLRPADPVALGRDLREIGFSVGFVQRLPFGLAVGLRYDTYNPDADDSERQGRDLVPIDPSVSTWAAVAFWRVHPRAEVGLEYDHEDNAFGRDETGRPARLADDRLSVRAHVEF